jgi:hypothetical protein
MDENSTSFTDKLLTRLHYRLRSPLYSLDMTEPQFESTNTETAILSRLIEPESSGLALEAARYVLTLEFKDPDQQRMNELAEKARDGALTTGEERELENYRHVGHLLALLRSKARVSLRQLNVR